MISEKVLRAIEFDKVLKDLASYAVLQKTKEKIENIALADDYDQAALLLKKTVEADKLLYIYGVGQVEFFDAFDDEFDRLRLHGTLSMASLLRFMRLLRSARITRNSVLGAEDEGISELRTLATGLFSDQTLEKEIGEKILSEDAVSDHASERLYAIRTKIKRLNVEIREKLQSYIRKDNAKFLQDSLVTMRGDRYVIPVKSEYRSSVKGFVHDQSASGSTVFIEPEVVLELNNELKENMLLEEAEIDRILSELSEEVGAIALPLARDIEILEELDLYFAKATYGYKTKSVPPVLNSHGKVEIKKGRHPLIAADKVVPLDVHFGGENRYLLITGPNTGGKTVTLKLVGLFSAMALAGLFVPCYQAELAVFNKIFCDVGDEQSIEQSLSTFSSHMTNIVSIVKEADENSLVLIDEIGAGTDPEEGSALALAVLETLLDKNTSGIVTTHYQALKEFAFRDERIVNASMEFNPFTFAPVYKINIGLPGSSNAIAISRRLGLSKEIAERATEHLSGHKIAFEHVLKKAEESRKAAEDEREELERLKKEAQEELATIRTERTALQNEREKVSAAAKIEFRRMVGERLYEADDLLEQIKEILDKEEITSGDLITARTLRNRVEDAKFRAESEDTDTLSYKDAPFEAFSVGQEVFVKSVGTLGTVVSLNPKKKEIFVLVGQMKTAVKASALALPTYPLPEKKKTKPVIRTANVSTPAQTALTSELMLIGKRVDEALIDLDAFLDQAALNGVEEVRIVHGKGTGRLQQAVGAHLKGHPLIKEFRLGRYGEGEHGVTIAKLK